jgi:hypothetical protein
MPDYTEVVVLCEDRQQEVFARYFLVKCGVHPRRIRVRIAPSGGGAGEQFVRDNYPSEVKAFRSRKYLNISLVVFIDSDPDYTVADRMLQLKKGLENASIEDRKPEEKIAIFIPKRNIETWIHYLKGENVNEQAQYPKLENVSACKPEVQQLAENRNQPLPDTAPDSLKRACPEMHRIL